MSNTYDRFYTYNLTELKYVPKFSLFQLYNTIDTNNGKLLKKYDEGFYYLDSEDCIKGVYPEYIPLFLGSTYDIFVKRIKLYDINIIDIFEDHWLKFDELSQSVVVDNEQKILLGKFTTKSAGPKFVQLSLFMYYSDEFYFYNSYKDTWVPMSDSEDQYIRGSELTGFVKIY